ncbi:SMI1/KNR4 family protein [Streptomyces beijiangensis]|uniref:SMI1/KNR4 family protein n=1 Tax=Streptomyces beijiangensis TaxID=163361 RepID=A0A939F8X6_9ACTN|nr:SMI1/KNR4 family protein [Streptomyces beijiangensis]MBO0514791.1 SMI1/KNR4 family protein [Streptomyces beijiangensis]
MSDDMQRAQTVEERQVTDAWRRIASWLRQHAPATLEELLPGASEEEIAALEQALGVRIPVGLKALWRECAGVQSGSGAVFLLERRALMRFDAIVVVYQMQIQLQRRSQTLSERRGEVQEVALWQPSWIPFCSFGADDYTYGLSLDAETGRLWSWSQFAERSVEFESLTAYLEEMADVLEVPSLATGYRPGLVNDALEWGPPEDPEQRALWVPYSG